VGGPLPSEAAVRPYRRLPDTTWFLDHYAGSHHYGHWQQTAAILFAALRREDAYRLGRLARVFVPRMRSPLRGPEEFYLDLALSVLSYRLEPIVWCAAATALARAQHPHTDDLSALLLLLRP
jgi:hypothetical protein